MRGRWGKTATLGRPMRRLEPAAPLRDTAGTGDARPPMFFTPPSLPPLGFDLDWIHVVGSVPSQGEARLLDGRSFEISYRHGWLKLTWIEPGPQAEAGSVFFERAVGPEYDGCITAGQLGELLGLRLRGLPLLIGSAGDRKATDATSDLSGRTTYWTAHALLTAADAEALLARLGRRFPGIAVLSLVTQHDASGDPIGFQWERVREPSIAASHHSLALLPAMPESLERAAIGAALDRGGVQLRAGWHLRTRPAFNHRLTVGSRSYDRSGVLPTVFSGQFLRSEAAGSAFVHGIAEVLEAYCSCRVVLFDLASGEVVRAEENPRMRHGPDYATWFHQADDRLLGEHQDESGRWLGCRPA